MSLVQQPDERVFDFLNELFDSEANDLNDYLSLSFSRNDLTRGLQIRLETELSTHRKSTSKNTLHSSAIPLDYAIDSNIHKALCI
jgi:hypothetical protein